MQSPNTVAQFAGRVAIVTGGASGIGQAVAERLASRGAMVFSADRNLELNVAEATRQQTLGFDIRPVAIDVCDRQSVRAVIAEIAEKAGGLHLAVNCAGISKWGPRLADVPFEDWFAVIDVNLNGVFHCLQAEIPLMLRSGGGSIVNIASVVGHVGSVGFAAYATSKHAVLGLTKCAALDYARHGVRVNAVAPGFVESPLLARYDEARRRQTQGRHPMGRYMSTREVANAIAFLLSDEASSITGACIDVDGGFGADGHRMNWLVPHSPDNPVQLPGLIPPGTLES